DARSTTESHKTGQNGPPAAPADDGKPHTTLRKRTGYPGKALAVFGVVEAGQPGGQAVHGGLEVRVKVDEVAQPLGQPGDGDLLVALPVGQLLDPPVGEVHQGIAVSMSAVCDAACRAAEPSAGAELGGSDTAPTSR